MSCGCGVTCDFKDKLCKDPFKPEAETYAVGQEGTAPPAKTLAAVKEFNICEKHKKAADKSMLTFVMAERMDEAIEDARRPVLRQPASSPMALEGTEGASVEKVAAAGAGRARRLPGVKKMTRSPEALKAAGAQLDAQLVQPEEVEFDPNSNVKSLDELLDGTDPTENKVAIVEVD
jgi:hypothetical protein